MMSSLSEFGSLHPTSIRPCVWPLGQERRFERASATFSQAMLWPILSLTAQAQSAVTEQEAQSIAVDAYIYLYPLILMDITRKQSTNIEPGKEFGKGPMNMFVNVP